MRGSHDWADHAADVLRMAGADVLAIRGSGEPELEHLEAALAQGRAFDAQVVLAVGGGSVLDSGKALAALIPSKSSPLTHLEVVGDGLPLQTPPLPFIALPTTAGTGAEVTKNAVIGALGRKVSLRDNRMLANLALVDPALTDGCPRGVTLASGMDALVQVIEPYVCNRANPMTDALARQAIPKGIASIAALRTGLVCSIEAAGRHRKSMQSSFATLLSLLAFSEPLNAAFGGQFLFLSAALPHPDGWINGSFGPITGGAPPARREGMTHKSQASPNLHVSAWQCAGLCGVCAVSSSTNPQILSDGVARQPCPLRNLRYGHPAPPCPPSKNDQKRPCRSVQLPPTIPVRGTVSYGSFLSGKSDR